jgi:molecular chaperone GrpE (heat shock protein)
MEGHDTHAASPLGAPASATEEAFARAIDELDAAKARLARDSQALQADTERSLVVRLLPILDNLDRALAATADGPRVALTQGVALVREQLAEVVRDYGFERFDPEGQPFDPRQHEAVAVVPVDRPELDGKVTAVTEPGYRVGERLLRPARVHVGRYRPGPGRIRN